MNFFPLAIIKISVMIIMFLRRAIPISSPHPSLTRIAIEVQGLLYREQLNRIFKYTICLDSHYP